MSFNKKRLRIVFTLANNAQFEGTNSNVLMLEGFRCRVRVKSAGAAVAPSADIAVYGVKQSDMNALTMLAWRPLSIQPNFVRVQANDGRGFVDVFAGDIVSAGPDYTQAPDVFLSVQAVTGYFLRLQPAAPSSYTGSVSVAEVVEDLALAMGLVPETNGVDIRIQSPYLPNTLGEQLRTFCEQAGVDLYLDGDVIAITPRGQPRQGQQVELNRQSGLILYPTIDVNGLQVQCLYNPGLRFGGQVHITSDVPKANGNWYIYSIEHDLQPEAPGGGWFSYLGLTDTDRLVVLQ